MSTNSTSVSTDYAFEMACSNIRLIAEWRVLSVTLI